MQNTNLINHVALVIDDSGSMRSFKNKVISVVQEQVASLEKQSKETGQETRLSIYTFGRSATCLAFDRSLAGTPSIERMYGADKPNTAIIDTVKRVVDELKTVPAVYGDHAFLVYVVTDGDENVNPSGGPTLRAKLGALPENWTLAVLVPDANGVRLAESYGFSKDNIQIWETTERGLGAASDTLRGATQSYMSARSVGIKGTKTLFKFNSVSKTEVKQKLEEISAGEYETLLVRSGDDGKAIKDFVESWTKRPYRVGSVYYQVTKPEKIQAGKNVAVVEQATGKMFSGVKARSLIGLPNYEVKVAPADFKNFDLFVQSTSTNRKLVADTHLVVFK